MVSLAIDLGRVQVAKTQLQRAVDAAARAGAASLGSGGSDSDIRDAVTLWASYNKVDGNDLLVKSDDVQLGNWDSSASPKFSTTRVPKNAVKVNGALTTARGNAVPLICARVLGQSNCEVHANVIATCATNFYGMVGLDYISLKGNAVASYWSDGSAGTGDQGNVASNGSITLNGNTLIRGDAHPGPGQTVSDVGKVTGSTAPLTAPLSFPNGNAGAYATNNDNTIIPAAFMTTNGGLRVGNNKSLTLPGGNYYFNDVDLKAGGVLTFTGPATIYCYGNLDVSGHAVTFGNIPGNLKIVMCPDSNGNPPGWVWSHGTSDLYANIYSPQNQFFSDGSGQIYGWLVARSIDMTGTSNVYYDLASKGTGAVMLVQ